MRRSDVSQLTPMGRLPSQRLFTVKGIFQSGGDADVSQILVNQQDAARLMRYQPGNIQSNKPSLLICICFSDAIVRLFKEELLIT